MYIYGYKHAARLPLRAGMPLCSAAATRLPMPRARRGVRHFSRVRVQGHVRNCEVAASLIQAKRTRACA